MYGFISIVRRLKSEHFCLLFEQNTNSFVDIMVNTQIIVAFISWKYFIDW